MKIYELAQEVEQYVISMRRYFHEHPEISDKEEKTVERIAQELTDMGVDHVVVPRGGIIATFKGETEGKGKTVMLRADCDALAIQEDPNNLVGPRTCCSQNSGAMHACGHDGHTAMLLGVAKILQANKDKIHGTIILMFERGEEMTGNLGFLLAYIEQHGIKIDACYGTHLYAMLESGKIGIINGGVMAAPMGFQVTIKGRGGHGSRPDQSISPIDCFAAVNQALMGARLQRITPYEALAYSICTVHSGTAANIIPDELTFSGSARSLNREATGLPFKEEFIKIINSVCEAYNCKATFDKLTGPSFSVFNDPELAQLAREAIAAELGTDAVCQPEPWMASESFSTIQKMFSGVFALLGVKNDAKGIGAAHHNSFFDLDEDVFKLGVTGAISYAFAFLDSDIDTKNKQWNQGYEALLKELNTDPARIDEFFGR